MGIGTKRFNLMLKKILTTLFTIREPIGRLDFFKYGLSLWVIGISIFYFYMYRPNLLNLIPIDSVQKILNIIILIFVILWILFVFITSFILITKRFWDIFGKKTPAIICAIIFMIIAKLSKIIAPFLVIKGLLSIALIFTKGRTINNNIQPEKDNVEENQNTGEG